MARPGTSGAKAQGLAQLEGEGATIVEADLADPDSLACAVEGVEVVVSALQGLREVIVDGQIALLRAAEGAGARRFIPSDFSIDLFRLEDGSNRNLDLRREFNRILDASPVAGTSVLNGAFTEMLVFGFPILDAQRERFEVWGDPDQRLQFTTTDDAAAWTAEAALDPDAPRVLRFAGDTVSQRELHGLCEEWLGRPLELDRRGEPDALARETERERAENPGEPGDLFPRWQALQYLHNMVSGSGTFDELSNDRYPSVSPTPVRDFLLANPAR